MRKDLSDDHEGKATNAPVFDDGAYVFSGKVLPERASTSLGLTTVIRSEKGDVPVHVDIVLNQISAVVGGETELDILALRNAVEKIVKDALSAYGFLAGDFRRVEISHVVNIRKGMHLVFSTGVPCLCGRHSQSSLGGKITALFSVAGGRNGVYVSRCFSLLALAMETPGETGNFCWQALESLKMHLVEENGLETLDSREQWRNFSMKTGCDEDILVAAASDACFRPGGIPSDERKEILLRTWNIVERYFGVEPDALRGDE